MLRRMGNVILAAAGIFLLFFLKTPLMRLLGCLGAAFARRFIHPVEGRLLRWLQDRATARAFGSSIDVVRIRRKADTGEP